MSTTTGRRITYGATTFTRIHEGKPRPYGGIGAPRWACDTCGREGWGEMLLPAYQWSTTCARGHHPCPWCGKQVAVCMDGQPRVHKDCQHRPGEADDEWTEAKQEVKRVRLILAEGAAS